ncbi:hypothetical protein THAOC_15571 [Thalassiosira oceanica]|uniref:Uncharacterized protein n=1 Tax=Thalassiosira oceanica TaxID=159749 RepID=K0SCF7_THAOC|nr:hypothetical protein THAOC_15571 [Thalassiosira oceanica]|eukprot:EJK63753.1 hypothetical protein THAOC_15571 [Thalassiosira oceanica]
MYRTFTLHQNGDTPFIRYMYDVLSTAVNPAWSTPSFQGRRCATSDGSREVIVSKAKNLESLHRKVESSFVTEDFDSWVDFRKSGCV